MPSTIKDYVSFVNFRFYETGSVKPGSIGGTKPKVKSFDLIESIRIEYNLLSLLLGM